MLTRGFSMELLPAERPGVESVVLSGELDVAAAPVVEDFLLDMFSPTVEVDLSHLTFIDARGLGMLEWAQQRFEETGRHLLLQSAGGTVRQVFELLDRESMLSQMALPAH